MRTPHDPLVIERAEGPWLITSEGRRILDAGAGAVVVNIGQGREELAQVAAEEVARLNYIVPVWSSAARERLTARLSRWMPTGLNRFFFTSGGSEAVEAALKFAIMYQKTKGRPQKYKIISRWFSYHGNTLAALSVGGNLGRRADYEHMLLRWPHIGPPFCYRCPWGKTYPECSIECATALEQEIIEQGADSIAAFIAEPMMGATGGAVPPVKEYWPKIVEICRRYDVLLIADEVMTGFGRTGKWFAVDHESVVPDMMTFAKGVNAGYVPLGGVIVNEKIAKHFDTNVLWAGLTYAGHPLACAAGVATVNAYRDERLIERGAKMGELLMKELRTIAARHPSVGDVRGRGLFAGIELVKDRGTKEMLEQWNRPVAKLQTAIKNVLFSKDVYTLNRWNMIFAAPPLTVTDDELRFGVQAIDAALDVADRYAATGELPA
jgi:adenosylmethionine-8-amino-7-oxononanoate aminotransferase